MEQKPPMPEEVHNEHSESEKLEPAEARQALEEEMRRLQSNELMRLATLEAENLQLTDRLDRCAEAYNGIAEQLRETRAYAEALAGALKDCSKKLRFYMYDASDHGVLRNADFLLTVYRKHRSRENPNGQK